MKQGNFSLILSGVIAIIISIIMGAVAISELDTAATAANPQVTQTDNLLCEVGTSDNITLGTDLWEGAVANVISISSNRTADVPAASTYTAATNFLLISGLSGNATTTGNRTLTTTYYDMPNEFDGLYSIMSIYGIIIWVVLTGAGLAMLGFGTAGVIQSRRTSRSSKARR